MKKTILILILSFFVIFHSVNCQVSGSVFRDFNANGQKDNSAAFNENGVGDIVVTAFNNTDIAIASYKTNTAGVFSIPALGAAYNNVIGSNTGYIPIGMAVRIEFTGLKNSEYTAPVGIDNKGSVQFAVAPAINVNFAVNNPDHYSQAAPRLVTSVYQEGNAPIAEKVLISVDYTASGSSKAYPNISTEAVQSQLGATYGLAYHRLSNTLFASSYQKRHTSYGMSNSTGAIYKLTNPTDNSSAGVSLFLDINALFGYDIAGANPHPNGSTDFSRDDASYGLIGKIAFGDMDVSEDGMSLWAINLNDRYLYKIPLGTDPYNPIAPTSGSAIGRYPLFNICDCNSDGLNDLATDEDARPFVIKPYQGKIYVGLICNGSSTPTNFNNLRARVFAFDPVTLTSTEVLNFALNYNRGNGNTGAVPFPNGIPAGSGYTAPNAANWRPWNDVYTNAAGFEWSWYDPAYGEGGYSQPIFAGLEFDDDGNMIIGLRDRFGDMIGDGVYDPGGTSLMEGNGNGDLLRAIPNGSGTGWNFIISEGMHGTEYFRDDNFGGLHQETSMGGLALYHGADHVINTVMDPVNNLSGGFDWTRLSDGRLDRSYEIVRRGSGTASLSHLFAKANALGEIELILPPAPLEIGNRVWNDLDGDGIQDANEPGIAGVIINLYDATGISLLASTTTDASGNWYFNDFNVPGGITVLTKYKISVSPTQFNIVGYGVLNALYLSPRNIAGNGYQDYSDNDAQFTTGGLAEISVETEFSGANNHTYDFGFTAVSILLDRENLTLTANKESTGAYLKWVSEGINNEAFIVERSSNGISFATIGTVYSGTSAVYADFTDKKPLAGVNFYRIKALKSGRVLYSNIATLNLKGSVSISVYPIPATDHLTISIKDSNSPELVVLLYNGAGQLALQQAYHNWQGTGTISINNLKQFSQGTYYLKVMGQNTVLLQQKLIITR
jgi:hypothetical protein